MYKYSLIIRGARENRIKFAEELKRIGYNGYNSGNLASLIINSPKEVVSTSQKNGHFGDVNGPKDRDYSFNIDNKWEHDAALAIAAIHDDADTHNGEVWIYETINSRDAYIINSVDIHKNCIISGIFRDCTVNNNSYGKIAEGLYGWKKATPQQIIEKSKEFYMTSSSIGTTTTTSGRKIIGYKAPFDMFGGEDKKGDIFSLVSPTSIFYKTRNVGATQYSRHLPKEIVEKWKVVYEEEEVTLKGIGSNNRDVRVSKGKIYFVGRNGEDISVEQLSKLLGMSLTAINLIQDSTKIAGYDVSIDSATKFILIGCAEEDNRFSINDLSKVVEAYDRINNV